MLKVFRDNLKYLSWVLWLVIFVFVLFMFANPGGNSAAGPASETAATVGEAEISYTEFQRSYERAESFYREAYGGDFDREQARQLGLPMQVINQLVTEHILALEASRMGLSVSDEEVKQAIVEMPELQQDGRFIGRKAYERLLRANRMSVEQFHEDLRHDLLTRKVRQVLNDTVYVSPQEIERAYRDQAVTATVRYAAVPASRFAGEVQISEEDLAAWFDENRESYRLPERRVVSYLTVSPADLRAGLAIDEDALRSAYQENAEDYRRDEQVRARHILLRDTEERDAAAARAQLQEIRDRIEGGEDFAAVAREVSEDPGSKDKGGDLGYFGRGEMIAPFEAAAFGAEPGELVGPVETDFGFHLIQVEDRRAAGLQPFDEVADTIRNRLLTERANALAEQKAGELADRAVREDLDGQALEALAQEEDGVAFDTTDPFGRDDNVPEIGRATPFTTTAFELEEGASSAPVRIAGGWAVLRLDEIREPRLPELDEVRLEVERDLRQAKQLELARAAADEMRAAVAGGEALDDVAGRFEVEVQEGGPFGLRDSIPGLGRETAVARAALELDAGAVGGPVTVDQKAVVFEVTERTEFDPGAFEAARQATRERLESQRFNELLTSLIAQRREELDVRFDPALLENFGLQG